MSNIKFKTSRPKTKQIIALLCGLLGSLCIGASDWLMMYGDTVHSGSLFWLTEGVIAIAPWRNALAMVLVFPGVILDGIALFSLEQTIKAEQDKKRYHILTVFSLTPWMALHLFYIMILYLFRWLSLNGFTAAALPACEALYTHLSFVVPLCMMLMVPPFLYWFYLQAGGKTVFGRGMAFTNVLFIYILLSGVKLMLPEGAFRIGYTNGLMSESMFLWFLILLLWMKTHRRKVSVMNESNIKPDLQKKAAE